MSAAMNDVGVESMDIGFIDRQLIREQLAIAERREAWILNKDHLAPIVNVMRKLGAEVQLHDCLHVSLTGDAKKLAGAVRALRVSAYSSRADRPVKGDTTWNAFFDRDGSTMRIFLRFTSSVCRLVKTGVKMVEQPVYETVCDDITLPAAEELAAKIIELTETPAAIIDEVPF